jgi:hypothetical protein
MAVTEEHPQIKAEIVVNGVALEPYEDDEVTATLAVVTKYVEATSEPTSLSTSTSRRHGLGIRFCSTSALMGTMSVALSSNRRNSVALLYSAPSQDPTLSGRGCGISRTSVSLT